MYSPSKANPIHNPQMDEIINPLPHWKDENPNGQSKILTHNSKRGFPYLSAREQEIIKQKIIDQHMGINRIKEYKVTGPIGEKKRLRWKYQTKLNKSAIYNKRKLDFEKIKSKPFEFSPVKGSVRVIHGSQFLDVNLKKLSPPHNKDDYQFRSQ